MSTSIAYRRSDLDILAAIEDRHFWFRARQRIIIDALRRWFPDARSCLEIGAGSGYNGRAIARAFPGWRVVLSDALLDDDQCRRIEVSNIPFERSFDVVAAFDVLEHVEDDRSAILQMRKACRPGGGLLLTVPQHEWLWSAADVYAQHYRRYDSGRLRALLRACGLSVTGHSSFHTVNLPAFLLRNAMLRVRPYRPETAPPREPLNRLLEAGMEIDRRLIAAGVRLPVGSSLLIAARRAD